MRIDEVMSLTASDIERRLDRMEVRQSSTGKLHLFPDDRSGYDDRRSIKMTFCGLEERRLEQPDVYQRSARDWSESALIPPYRRCERCRYSWQARLDLVPG